MQRMTGLRMTIIFKLTGTHRFRHVPILVLRWGEVAYIVLPLCMHLRILEAVVVNPNSLSPHVSTTQESIRHFVPSYLTMTSMWEV